ncbi:MAG: quinoprotein relay system zinc metallohydrolase 1 [Burkholderiales bacterium]|nr:quinoprotein relay system zinc metallohydrolase 1 [Burkholderiales bacterium]
MKLHAKLSTALAAAALLLGAAPAWSQTPSAPAGPRVDQARFDLGLQAREVGAGVYVVEGANADFSPANGCNIINTGFIVTGAGVLVINTGTSKRQGEQLRALIARTTREPVVQVVQLNLHPDYFLGNQAFADVPRRATTLTRAGVAREASAYETNLYRLCGDWMSGTETLAPDRGLDDVLDPVTHRGRWRIGARDFELVELAGHTDSDLVLIDRHSGIAFVGGLVFVDRIPTTPHARLTTWQASLATLRALAEHEKLRLLVPSHGPVRPGLDGIAQTSNYLRWLDEHFSLWARQGWEMTEVLRAPVPAPYSGWAAFQTEYLRNVVHLYPGYEQQALRAAPGR